MKRKTLRRFTIDRGPPATVTPVHTSEQISENMELLPNGNLLCRNVPFARIGWLIYGPGETPVSVGDNGLAYIQREEQALFNDTTLGSFQYSAVTDDHPEEDVTPQNYSKLAKGFVLNPRRGEGDDRDVAFCDMMITDKDAIAAIRAGKREVSAGYIADYEEVVKGTGRQFNILGNHVALVEKGRCGPRCAIGDQIYQPTPSKERKMTKRVQLRRTEDAAKQAARQKVLDAQAELDALEDEGEDDGSIHVHIHQGGNTTDAAANDESKPSKTNDRLGALEVTMDKLMKSVTSISKALSGKRTGDKKRGRDESEEEKEEEEVDKESTGDASGEEEDDPDATGTEDEMPEDDEDDDSKKSKDKKKGRDEDPTKTATQDSAALETSYKALITQAEVLVPGFKVPTFDGKLKRAVTIDRMCAARRKVLDQVDPAFLTAIGGKTYDSLSLDCAGVAVLFKEAAKAQAASNNRRATGDSKTVPTPKEEGGAKQFTLAEINKQAAEFWKGH